MRSPQTLVTSTLVVLLTAVTVSFSIRSLVAAQSAAASRSKEVRTHLATTLPPGQGAPICFEGSDEPIGRVSGVNLLPGHEKYRDAWELIVEINEPFAKRISADSVIYAEGLGNCGQSPSPFLEITTGETGPPIVNGTMLQGSVEYVADVAIMIPRSRWQQLMDWVEMDVGFLWLEVAGVITVAGTVIMVLLVRRRRAQSR